MSAVADLRARARKCRELARGATDGRVVANLLSLADEYDWEAAKLEAGPAPTPE